MRRVLLIADLEGICGVDTLSSLVFCSRDYPAAARRMSEEVAFVARGLRERGVEHVRISDAHRAGAGDTNLDEALLPDGCEVRLRDDMYGGPLLDGVDAVVCVGMHASGGTQGFAAHTVALHTAWSLGGAPLSETHVAQRLAAERGVPLWFTAGDQVLASEVGPLPCIVTKTSASRGVTRSRPRAEVEAALSEALGRPLPPVVSFPAGPLVIRFQRRAEAEAARAAGGVLRSATELVLPPAPRFSDQYDEALRLIAATDDVMGERITGAPGTQQFADSAARLLLEEWQT